MPIEMRSPLQLRAKYAELADFLLARIAEDEEEARAAQGPRWVAAAKRRGEPGRWRGVDAWAVGLPPTDDADLPFSKEVARCDDVRNSEHIARWDPARVIAECRLKRLLVERWQACVWSEDDALQRKTGDRAAVAAPDGSWTLAIVMGDMAGIYRGHPDFRPSWQVHQA